MSASHAIGQASPSTANLSRRATSTLQRAAVTTAADNSEAPTIVHEVLRSPGQPLNAFTRAYMEPRFGHNFSHVRVHADDRSARSANAIRARAWTAGNHIAFNTNQYFPESNDGRELLAHELSHVVQQRGIRIPPDTNLPIGARGNAYERAAQTASHDALTEQKPSELLGLATPQVQRDEPVPVDIEVASPKKSEELRQQGVDLPRVSAQAADPRSHSDFIDRRISAVGFGIYLGGYHLYVDGLDLPVFLPSSYVSHTTKNVVNVDSVIYASRDEAIAAIPVGPQVAGQATPMTYFRGVGGLVFPAFVSPGAAPQTYKTMIEAQQELGRQVSNELTVLALSLLGGMLIKGAIGGIRRVTGRPATAPAAPPQNATRNAPSPGGPSGPQAGTGGSKDLFYKPKVRADPTLPPGAGATNKYGDVRYSSQGTQSDVALAKYHESVHSALSPKLRYFREVRANVGMTGYQKSQFLRYLEEALAETFAQLRVKGISGLPAGIQFPIKNGYVSLTGVITEAAIGTVVVGGTTYGVYVVVTDTGEGNKKTPAPAQPQ